MTAQTRIGVAIFRRFGVSSWKLCMVNHTLRRRSPSAEAPAAIRPGKPPPTEAAVSEALITH
jgi:hypothetical protein